MTDFKRPFEFNTAYNQGKVVAGFAHYPNGNKAIQLYALDHTPVMRLTVNPGIELKPDEVAIKNYSENEDADSAAINAGLIQPFPRFHIESGMVKIPVYKLTPEALAMWKD